MMPMPRLRNAVFPKASVILLPRIRPSKKQYDSVPLRDGGQQMRIDECPVWQCPSEHPLSLKQAISLEGAV